MTWGADYGKTSPTILAAKEAKRTGPSYDMMRMIMNNSWLLKTLDLSLVAVQCKIVSTITAEYAVLGPWNKLDPAHILYIFLHLLNFKLDLQLYGMTALRGSPINFFTWP